MNLWKCIIILYTYVTCISICYTSVYLQCIVLSTPDHHATANKTGSTTIFPPINGKAREKKYLKILSQSLKLYTYIYNIRVERER